jgi:hypothetical protein
MRNLSVARISHDPSVFSSIWTALRRVEMGEGFKQALNQARRVNILEIAARHGVRDLRKEGGERVGPCPRCGGVNRFAINPKKRVFNCRGCQAGGDAISLARFLNGLSFRAAVESVNKAPIVEEDPSEAERSERKQKFLREVVAETVFRLTPVLGAPGEEYLRNERAIDTSLPMVRAALEQVDAIGWSESAYFSQPDPELPFHELHKRRLGAIIGVMTDPLTGHRTGGISRTYVWRGKKIGPAKTLKPEDAAMGVVMLCPAGPTLAVAEGKETALSVLEMGRLPTWSMGSAGVMRELPVIDGVDTLWIAADHDENRASERAARALRARWRSAGRLAEYTMPPNEGDDFNDILKARKR